MNPRVRTLTFAAALCLIACGSPSNGNDGGTDGGDSACDGTAKTPPNLIHNNGFECGGASPAEWSAPFGTLDFPTGSAHSGTRNARVTAGSNGDARIAYNLDVLDDGGMQTVCINAWVKGTTPFMKIRLLTSGTSCSQMEYDFSAPGGSTWQRVPPSLNLDAPNGDCARMELVFESQVGRSDGMNSVSGDTLELDDVDAWISPNGQCRER